MTLPPPVLVTFAVERRPRPQTTGPFPLRWDRLHRRNGRLGLVDSQVGTLSSVGGFVIIPVMQGDAAHSYR